MIYNSPKFKRNPTEKTLAKYFWVRSGILFSITGLMTILAALFFVTPDGTDCRSMMDEDATFNISGEVISPLDANVEVRITKPKGACSHSTAINQILLSESGEFATSFPYFLGESPITVRFLADGYQTCSFEYRLSDAIGTQFDIELADEWSITVTEMTLLPPRYVPHIRTFSC